MFWHLQQALRPFDGFLSPDGDTGEPNSGNGDPENSPAEKSGITEEQVTKLVNRAITGHLKRFEAKLGDTITSTVTEALKKAQPPEPPGDDKGDDKGGGQSKETQRLQAKLKELEAKVERSEQEKAELHERQRAGSLRQAIDEAMAKHGVSEALRGALRAQLVSEGRVKWDGDGEDARVVMPLQRSGYDEDVDVAAGLAEFLKTKEGKHFLPPSGAGGAGSAPGSNASSRRNGVPELTDIMRDAVND